jgi:hypothetical protein
MKYVQIFSKQSIAKRCGRNSLAFHWRSILFSYLVGIHDQLNGAPFVDFEPPPKKAGAKPLEI